MKAKNILWIASLLLLMAGTGCEVNKLESSEELGARTAEGIMVYENPATDGCGWLIRINDKLYRPVNLADEYKIENLKVSVDYQLLDSKYTCWPGRLIPEIKIVSIKKLQQQYESMIVYENPATDGCGWLVQINNKPYFPVNLADEYKIDKLKVSVDYQLLDSKFTCWPGRLIPEIKIVSIKKIQHP